MFYCAFMGGYMCVLLCNYARLYVCAVVHILEVICVCCCAFIGGYMCVLLCIYWRLYVWLLCIYGRLYVCAVVHLLEVICVAVVHLW